MVDSATTTASTAPRNLRTHVERDGKSLPQVSTISFLAVLLIGVPVWAFVLVPLLIMYQCVWKYLVCKVLFGKLATISPSPYGIKSVVPTPESIVSTDERPYDVVVLGATGFTGTMAVEYLLNRYRGSGEGGNSSKTAPQIRFAMAGRSKSKLEELQTRLRFEFEAKQKASSQDDNSTQTNSAIVDIIVVDTLIPSHVISLVQKTKVVVNFVGPYQLNGASIVMEACAKYGTHYIDITGELEFVKELLTWSPHNDGSTLDDIARQTGAKLISCCGCDCVPWDLTFFKLNELLQRQSPEEDLVYMQCWDELATQPSGGSLATAVALIRKPQAQHEFDPFLKLPISGEKSTARLEEDAQWWIGGTSTSSSMSIARSYRVTAPYAMAYFNTKVITRSLALLCGTKARDTVLRYREVSLFPDFASAFCSYFGMIVTLTVILLSAIPPLDYFLQMVLPKSGEGSSREAQEKFYLFLVGQGTGSRGTVVETALYFRSDPGYRDTARMAVESGLCLVVPESLAKIPSQRTGGFWTPSAALGNVLLERLVDSGTVFDSQVIIVHAPT